MRFCLYILIMVLFVGIPISDVFAQSFTNEPSVTITINPTDPEPGERITATLTSYETNLNLAQISWVHNGKNKTGYGETQFITNVGNDETKTEAITAVITLSDGQKIERQLLINPTSFDITWEAVNTKYPPFYKGKKIPIRENSIRVAIISPNRNPNITSYTWIRNGTNIKNPSGNTRPYIDFTNTEINKKENIEVAIVSKDKKANRNITIPFVNPKIIFYEYSPLTGLNLGNVTNDKVIGYENIVSILAIPVGYNNLSKNIINWELSNTSVPNQKNPYLLSFGAPDEKGVVNLTVNIQNAKTLYQEAKNSLALIF